MDKIITDEFEKYLNLYLKDIIISNSIDKNKISKVKIRPIAIKNNLYFQATEFIKEKVFHTNYKKDELIEKLPDWLEYNFKQVQIHSSEESIIILISKKGKAYIKKRSFSKPDNIVRMPKPDDDKIINLKDIKSSKKSNDDMSINFDKILQHNREKTYILKEGTYIPFLFDLGVMTKDGRIVKSKYDKFKQINRFLEFIDDVIENFDKNKKLTIIDFGCGKSYFTFAIYYYFKIIKNYNIKIIGLDLKKDVVHNCIMLKTKYNYNEMEFLRGDIASFDDIDNVDMMVALHACDTATDYAIYKAIKWNAKVILSVPCCQHEINKQIKNDSLEPILKYGIIKERMSALITDAIRADLLETQGYKVQVMEFIDIENTPKNLLIRAVKTNKEKADILNYDSFMNEFNIKPKLYDLLSKTNS